jgi:hypothetical protein
VRDLEMKIAVLLSAFWAVLVTGQDQNLKQSTYRGPLCLGGFCLDKPPLPSEKKLVAKYGPGSSISDFRCYAVSEQKVFVHFGVEHHLPGEIVTVFVSSVPNCVTRSALATPRASFPIFATKEGVRIGDSYEKVLKIYGKPSSTRPGSDGLFEVLPYSRERKGAPFGDTVLVYDGPSDELIQGKFYLRKGRVTALYISCSE